MEKDTTIQSVELMNHYHSEIIEAIDKNTNPSVFLTQYVLSVMKAHHSENLTVIDIKDVLENIKLLTSKPDEK